MKPTDPLVPKAQYFREQLDDRFLWENCCKWTMLNIARKNKKVPLITPQL